MLVNNGAASPRAEPLQTCRAAPHLWGNAMRQRFSDKHERRAMGSDLNSGQAEMMGVQAFTEKLQ